MRSVRLRVQHEGFSNVHSVTRDLEPQVPGTVVFDSIAWISPISLSALSACALLRLEVSDPRLVSKPASRWRRRVWEFVGYACVIGIVAIYFIFISQARISRYWDSRDNAFARWPQLTFADLIVKAISFCLGPAGLLFALGALLPAARGAPILAALGVPASEAMRAHTKLGRVSVVCLLGHAFGYLFHWFRRGGLVEMWTEATEWSLFGINNLAGTIALFGGGGLLAASAHPVIRRRWYSSFYCAHLVGSLVFIVMAAAHWKSSVFFFAPATLLWAAELAQRRRQRVRKSGEVMATRVSDTLVKLWFPLRGDGPYPISKALSANEFVYLR